MRRAGFTLVEVVVALVILQVGLLGAMGMVVLAQRTLAQADRMERGVAEMEGLLDSIGSSAAAPSGSSRRIEAGLVTWSVAADGTITLRFTPAGPGPALEVLSRAAVPAGVGGA